MLADANSEQEDPGAMLEIKEDIREECAKLGEVTNVVLFDKEPDGVASVRFANAQAARACVDVSNSPTAARRPLSRIAHEWPMVRRTTTRSPCRARKRKVQEV